MNWWYLLIFFPNLFLAILGQFSQVGNWSRDGLETAVSVDVKEAKKEAVLLENSSTAIRVKTRVVSFRPPANFQPKSYQERNMKWSFPCEIMDMFLKRPWCSLLTSLLGDAQIENFLDCQLNLDSLFVPKLEFDMLALFLSRILQFKQEHFLYFYQFFKNFFGFF